MAENFEPIRKRKVTPNRQDRTRSAAAKRRTQDFKRLRRNKQGR